MLISVISVLYLVLLPVQFRVGEALRVSPADLLICAYLLFGGRTAVLMFRACQSVWQVMVGTLTLVGVFVFVERYGVLSTYTVFNKAIGLAVLLVTFAVVGELVKSATARDRFISAFVWSVTAHCGLAVGFMWLQREGILDATWINYSRGQRLSGLLVDPNAFGGIVTCALLICISRVMSTQKIGWTAPIQMPLLAASLFLTFSRTAYIASLVGLCSLLVLWPKFRKVSGIAIICLIGMYFGIKNIYDSDGEKHELIFRTNTIEERLELNAKAIDGFISSPIVGLGLGGFYEKEKFIAHNTVLFVLCDFGIVGIVVFGVVFYRMAKVARSALKVRTGEVWISRGVVAGLIAIVAYALAIEALYQRYLWCLLAVAEGLAQDRSGRLRRVVSHSVLQWRTRQMATHSICLHSTIEQMQPLSRNMLGVRRSRPTAR